MIGDDQSALLSASLRHQEDAALLLSTSHDQSWHLAGYVTECVRKACLTIAPFRKALAHEQGRDADALLEVVLALDGRASRLRLHGWAPAGSKLAQWSETHRYDRTGAHADTAAALVDETALLLDATLAALWLAYPFDPGTL